MTDCDHRRWIGVVRSITQAETHVCASRSWSHDSAARTSILVCGYACPVYEPLDSWRSIDHRVPTRGGLQDERIWLNFDRPDHLHDYRYIGKNRRQRERIRRRQKNWASQLSAMCDRERNAMLSHLLEATRSTPPTDPEAA